VHEPAKIGIVHYTLEKLLILSSGRWFTGEKKIVQSNRGRAERVRFDNVGAGIEILGVDLLD
jgi:hypothetical protein